MSNSDIFDDDSSLTLDNYEKIFQVMVRAALAKKSQFIFMEKDGGVGKITAWLNGMHDFMIISEQHFLPFVSYLADKANVVLDHTKCVQRGGVELDIDGSSVEVDFAFLADQQYARAVAVTIGDREVAKVLSEIEENTPVGLIQIVLNKMIAERALTVVFVPAEDPGRTDVYSLYSNGDYCHIMVLSEPIELIVACLKTIWSVHWNGEMEVRHLAKKNWVLRVVLGHPAVVIHNLTPYHLPT